MDPAMIERRRRMAEDAIKYALEKGNKLGGIAGVKRILQDEVQTSQLPIDFFDILPERDIYDLAIKVMESLSANENHIPATGVTTPPGSDSSAEDQRVEQVVEGNQNETREGTTFSTFEDTDPKFNAKIVHPINGLYLVAISRRCKEKQSYISRGFIEDNRLQDLVEPSESCETIKLNWNDPSDRAERTSWKTTRFRIVPDENIMYQIVIGTGCCDRGDIEQGDQTRDPDQSLVKGGRLQSESLMNSDLQGSAIFAASFYFELGKRQRQDSVGSEYGNKRSRFGDNG